MQPTELHAKLRGHRERLLTALGMMMVCSLVIHQSTEAQSFGLGRWTGFTELGFDFQDQDQATLEGERPLFERTVSEQRLGFRNTATIVSRRFLTVNFGLTLGFLQSQLTNSNEREASGDGRLRGFDVAATFMPLKSYGFNLFSSRFENVTPVEFAGSQRLVTSSLGLAMQVGPKSFPARLSYREVELESTSELGQVVRGLDQKTRTLSYRAENRWRRNEAYFFLQHQDVDDRVTNSFSNETQTASLNHTVELLEPQLAVLRSSVRYFNRSGDLTSSSFHIDEELRLRHRNNLTSGLRYELRDLDNSSGLANESRRQSAWIRHRLWESLETNFRIGRMSLSSVAGSSDQNEARLQLNYKKNLPGGGRLLGRIASTYDQRDSLGGDGQLLITRERHLARFGVPSRLDQPAVIPGTVIVTDELETTIFEENVDYEIRLIGEFVEILPLPGGRISDGQAIFVEYRVDAPGMSAFTSRRNDFSFSIDYSWIMPFFGCQSSSDDLGQGQPSTLLDDRRDRFAGVRLRKNGPRLKLVSFNEIRSRRSGLLAFESLRLADGLSYSPKPHWTVTANFVHVETKFETPTRDVRIGDAKFGVRWQPLAALSLESYATFREIRDTSATDQTFDRAGFEARWNLGKISVIAAAERWQRRRDEQNLDGLTGSLRISRRFFPGTVTSRRRAPEPEPWPADLPGLAPEPSEEEAVWEQDESAGTATSDLFDLAESDNATDQPPRPAAGAKAPEVPEQPGTVEPEPEAAEVRAAEPATDETQTSLKTDVRSLVEDWARAWSDQDVDRYLSSYSGDFHPAGGMSRDSWVQLRRSRLTELEWIEVRLDGLRIEDLGGERARAVFKQTYRSNQYSDQVQKALELNRENGQWKIVAEITR